MLQHAKAEFGLELSEGYRAGAWASGVDATVTGPHATDAARQVELFRELTATTPGGIAVAASSAGLLARPMADAAYSGIPVISVDVRPARGSSVEFHVGNDNYELGRLLAAEAIKRLPPNTTGKVILGNVSPGLPALEERAAGMHDQFAEKLPSARVLGPFDTQRDPSGNTWRFLVAANPDAVAFLGTGDLDASTLAGIRAGTKGTWLAGGCGIAPRNLQGVKEGQLFATVSPEHYLKAAVAGQLLAEHTKHGNPLPSGWLPTPGLVITPGNVDEIIRRQESESSKFAWFKPQLDALTANATRLVRPLDQAR